MNRFYTYRQNNSFGVWNGPEIVIVEAVSPAAADIIAMEHGVYFDGCREGTDCPCCGDRWSMADEWDAADVPSIYGEPVTFDVTGNLNAFVSYGSTYQIKIVYADGTVKESQ